MGGGRHKNHKQKAQNEIESCEQASGERSQREGSVCQLYSAEECGRSMNKNSLTPGVHVKSPSREALQLQVQLRIQNKPL